MPAFLVKYVDEKGRRRSERLFAPDTAYLKKSLRRKGCWTLNIEQDEVQSAKSSRITLSAAERIGILDQVEMQLDVDINPDAAFRQLVDEYPPGKSRQVVAAISDTIDSTGNVGDAFERFPRIFAPHVVRIIRVGQGTGKLKEAIGRIIAYYHQADALFAAVVTALVYPFVVTTLMVVLLAIVFTTTIPKFKLLFEELHAKLWWNTKILFAVADICVAHPVLTISCALLTPVLLVVCFKARFMRPILDRWAMKIPLVKGMIEAVCISRFAINLKVLYESDPSNLLHGLKMCIGVTGNSVYNEALRKAHALVEDGKKLGQALRASPGLFPPLVTLAITVGEHKGRLGQALGKIGDYYNRKAQERIKKGMTLFEPLVIVIMGVVIGGIVLSLILPVYDAIKSQQTGMLKLR